VSGNMSSRLEMSAVELISPSLPSIVGLLDMRVFRGGRPGARVLERLRGLCADSFPVDFVDRQRKMQEGE
jgi:hypothetical protein